MADRRDRALRLDHDRRQAVQDLVSLLTKLVEEAHTMTAAALGGDIDALADARTDLLELAAHPALDLARVTEIYNGLRSAIAGGPAPILPVPALFDGRISIAANPGTGQDGARDHCPGGCGVLPEDGHGSLR